MPPLYGKVMEFSSALKSLGKSEKFCQSPGAFFDKNVTIIQQKLKINKINCTNKFFWNKVINYQREKAQNTGKRSKSGCPGNFAAK